MALMKTPAKSSGNPDAIFRHSGNHDLESLFYVLLYISTFYSGPQKRMKQAELLKTHSSVSMLEWVNPKAFLQSFRFLGRLKMGHLIVFEYSIVPKITSFFSVLSCLALSR